MFEIEEFKVRDVLKVLDHEAFSLARTDLSQCPLDDLNSGIPEVIEGENCKIGRSRIEHS